MANIFVKRKIEPFFLLVFFCRLQKALLCASLKQAGSWRIWRDLFNSCDFMWWSHFFVFLCSFFLSFFRFFFFSIAFLEAIVSKFQDSFSGYELLFHSFSQSVRLLCSLITLPSVRFLFDCTTTTEAAASGVFLLDDSLRFVFFFHSVFQVSSQFSFRSTFGTPTRCC